MTRTILGLLALLILAACTQTPNLENENEDISNNHDNNSIETVPTEENTAVDEPELYVPLGTWMDLRTGEVMVFTEDKVYWAKKPGFEMTELGIKSKEKGNLAVYFENKPNNIYDMVYETKAEMMECRSGSKKINDYKFLIDNTDPNLVVAKLKEHFRATEFPSMDYTNVITNDIKDLEAIKDIEALIFYFHLNPKEWLNFSTVEIIGDLREVHAVSPRLALSDKVCVFWCKGTAVDIGCGKPYINLAVYVSGNNGIDAKDHIVHHSLYKRNCSNHWKDFIRITAIYPSKEGDDLLIDLIHEDKADETDEIWTKEVKARTLRHDPRNGKTTGDYLVTKTVRIDAETGKMTEENIKVKPM